MVDEKKEISEFNEAVNQIQRLHNHWLSFASQMSKGYLTKAKWTLDNVQGELNYDADKLDEIGSNDYKEKLKKINDKIFSTPKKVLEFNKNNKEKDAHQLVQMQNNLLYSYLRKKEEILREIQQESGKGGKYKRGDEGDID